MLSTAPVPRPTAGTAFIVLLSRSADLQRAVATLRMGQRTDAADRALFLAPPVRGIAFLRDDNAQLTLDEWWGASVPDGFEAVYLIEHEPELPEWVGTAEGAFYILVPNASVADAYRGIPEAHPVVGNNVRALAAAVMGDFAPGANARVGGPASTGQVLFDDQAVARLTAELGTGQAGPLQLGTNRGIAPPPVGGQAAIGSRSSSAPPSGLGSGLGSLSGVTTQIDLSQLNGAFPAAGPPPLNTGAPPATPSGNLPDWATAHPRPVGPPALPTAAAPSTAPFPPPAAGRGSFLPALPVPIPVPEEAASPTSDFSSPPVSPFGDEEPPAWLQAGFGSLLPPAPVLPPQLIPEPPKAARQAMSGPPEKASSPAPFALLFAMPDMRIRENIVSAKGRKKGKKDPKATTTFTTAQSASATGMPDPSTPSWIAEAAPPALPAAAPSWATPLHTPGADRGATRTGNATPSWQADSRSDFNPGPAPATPAMEASPLDETPTWMQAASGLGPRPAEISSGRRPGGMVAELKGKFTALFAKKPKAPDIAPALLSRAPLLVVVAHERPEGLPSHAAGMAMVAAQALKPHGRRVALVDLHRGSAIDPGRLGGAASMLRVQECVHALAQGVSPLLPQDALTCYAEVPDVTGYHSTELEIFIAHLRRDHDIVIVEVDSQLPDLDGHGAAACGRFWMQRADALVLRVGPDSDDGQSALAQLNTPGIPVAVVALTLSEALRGRRGFPLPEPDSLVALRQRAGGVVELPGAGRSSAVEGVSIYDLGGELHRGYSDLLTALAATPPRQGR